MEKSDLLSKLSPKGQKLHEIQDAIFAIMLQINEVSESDEYDTIMMNLVTASKGVNNIRLNEITSNLTINE